MSSLQVPTFSTVRDNILRVILNGYVARGIATPNVGYGSDDYVRAEGLAHEIEAAMAGTVVASDDMMPDTTSGEELTRWMSIVGLSLRPAGPSTGAIILASSTSTLVAAASELLDPATNARFTVTTGGTYSNGGRIPVQSVDTGKGTNLAGSTALKWVAPPAYASPTALLDSNGTSGGVDAEDEETGRQRLLDTLKNYPSGGNAAYVASISEGADPAIQKCFVYPCANGPGTEHAAVIGYASSSTSRSRVCAAATVTLASVAITAALPEYVESTVTACADQTADLSVTMQLPTTGGGFVDANPFPSVSGINTARVYAAVTNFTNTTSFRVESMAAPVAGQSICWIDRDAFVLHTAKILTLATHASPSGTTPGEYDVTIDTPFISAAGTAVAVADWIFPCSTNAANYLAAALTWFGALGPGEKQLSAGLLPHSYRQPRYFESWNYTIDSTYLRAVEDAGSEVLSVAWGYENGGTLTPDLPATISDAPNVFAPNQLAFYAA